MAEKDATFSDGRSIPLFIFFKDFRSVFKLDELGLEIARIAPPAALALTADPVASLVDTAFIGQIGAVELAAVGVAIALFNQVSRIAIFPLVSVTTSFVAEEDTITKDAADLKDSESLENGSSLDGENKMLIPQTDSSKKMCKLESGGNSFEIGKTEQGKKQIASASSALIIGAVLGILQAAFLILAAKPLLSFMGVKPDSEMSYPAQQYLKLRSLGAPAVLLSLAMQGVFRGLKDTKTPLYATGKCSYILKNVYRQTIKPSSVSNQLPYLNTSVFGDLANIVLDPIFMFVFKLGVRGAAIAHVISQYLISLILIWRLKQEVNLIPPSLKYLQFERFIKNGFLLLTRVIAVTFCVTLAASMAARLGSTQMAAFQVCLQVWLATSLLADGLAVAGQAILASAFARKDYSWATATASRVLQLGIALGLVLAVVLGFGLHFGARIFTKDADVLHLIGVGIPFVAATQPINTLAFVFDGVNFGASDFAYSAYSMVTVAIISIITLLALCSSGGFVGIWTALTIYMSLRAFAGFWRIGTGTGPWAFLRR
ncbi:UNVERIFIED_CONTAM: protein DETOXIFICATION 42 [Sesamum radiatum]|uniref:Protein DETOXIFICATION n=1 Tax=Sesamum radiatum TaxID=300843 RepID=A0AAW2W1G4_SESRA